MIRDYGGANAALCAVNAALAAGRVFTVNEDMLEAKGGFVEVFGAGHTERLTADLKEWAIVKYVAIKLNPGVWTYSSTVEATINAASQSGVSREDVAKILISGPRVKAEIPGSRRPRTFSRPSTVCRTSLPPPWLTRTSPGRTLRRRKSTARSPLG